MKKFFNEFKEFISKGNVMDMAIGVIIATAFGKITTSLVNDVFMPLTYNISYGIAFGLISYVFIKIACGVVKFQMAKL